MKARVLSIYADGLLDEIQSAVQYCKASSVPEKGARCISAIANWDTGASISFISHDVIRALGLVPSAQVRIRHSQGESVSYSYEVNIRLSGDIIIQDVTVLEGEVNLIGMDIIQMGDMAITNRDGRTVFSFQIPSAHRIDFKESAEL